MVVSKLHRCMEFLHHPKDAEQLAAVYCIVLAVGIRQELEYKLW